MASLDAGAAEERTEDTDEQRREDAGEGEDDEDNGKDAGKLVDARGPTKARGHAPAHTRDVSEELDEPPRLPYKEEADRHDRKRDRPPCRDQNKQAIEENPDGGNDQRPERHADTVLELVYHERAPAMDRD